MSEHVTSGRNHLPADDAGVDATDVEPVPVQHLRQPAAGPNACLEAGAYCKPPHVGTVVPLLASAYTVPSNGRPVPAASMDLLRAATPIPPDVARRYNLPAGVAPANGEAPAPQRPEKARHRATWAVAEAVARVAEAGEYPSGGTPARQASVLATALARTRNVAEQQLMGAGRALAARDEELEQLYAALAANDLDLKAARSDIEQLRAAGNVLRAENTERLKELAREKDRVSYSENRLREVQGAAMSAERALDKVLDKLVEIARESD